MLSNMHTMYQMYLSVSREQSIIDWILLYLQQCVDDMLTAEMHQQQQQEHHYGGIHTTKGHQFGLQVKAEETHHQLSIALG